MKNLPDSKILIIPAVTPYFLDKGEDWFLENKKKILSSRKRLSWWKDNTLILKENETLKPSTLVSKLIELGYARTNYPSFPGEFSGGGAYWLVFPIGGNLVWRVEFFGNKVERLLVHEKLEEAPRFILPKSQFGELAKLKPGDYVVHKDHGIGIFRGISVENISDSEFKIQEKSDKKAEFFVIEYAPPRDGQMPDRLLVPLDLAPKILTPYYGFEKPVVHRLGSKLWSLTRRKVREDILKIAKELLELYAKRHSATRPSWEFNSEMYFAIEEGFPYSLTEDQEKAIEDIVRDLTSKRPMDRLIVGDVGFGKTEIALRAAWIMVLAGGQAAMLAPTTILAEQHYRTFKERLEPLGCHVAMLSRLTNKQETVKILKGISQGSIDVVIGTHKILSSDVSFRRLGLLIVDEEQRFGVLQKEKLKMLRSSLDTLSLSATPIPRTLSMALAKLRPISLLNTPPPGRVGIKTFVLPYCQKIIKEAILKELRRDGQVYFLHNRIETIESRQKMLKKIIPEAKIEIIHGRMKEGEIMQTMSKFRERKIEVLVATTIIENGLDLSNANTLIVADSLRLGLGQAHQIRGRVGRGDVEAYAYFLYFPRNLTQIAKERLRVLKESEKLGSGFEIAMKDLEIRGAGNILGKQQSGAVNAVGLNLYMQMLAEAIEMLR